MKTILALIGKDARHFAGDKTAVLLTFFVPFFVIFLIGNIFSGADGNGGLTTKIELAVLDLSPDQSGAGLIEAMQADEGLEIITQIEQEGAEPIPFTRESIRQGIVDHHYNFALIIPENFVKEEGLGVRLEFLSNPKNNVEAQMINGLIQKNIFTGLPKVFAKQADAMQAEFLGDDNYRLFLDGLAALINLSSDEADLNLSGDDMSLTAFLESMEEMNEAEGESGGGAGDMLADLVVFEEDQVYGKEVQNPYLTRMVGGYAIMFLLFATTGSASSLFEERNAGMFLRLFSMPVKRTHILWSKYLFNMMLGTVQAIALFVGANLIFGVQIYDNFLNLLIVAICSASACTAFGMLLASISKSQQSAQGFGTLLIISMSALGGAWFPVTWMPEPMQLFSKFTIVYWGVEGFLGALWEKASFVELLPILGTILAISVLLNAVSIWRFKTGDLFR
ncbi:ABC transporter permease [Pelagicoccus sp. SDUM812003]|uniref:ABC transporter permease n=1 Tax=Pelagicoccus sp. SDUM812003 TaxID=3041267 RepID=UPI00280E61C4|nr:ABC transporter permease [Pelagicoccus sp. SDUM812003]MDQ8204189.1 ABC transporter permease [Pelagicoccus sp. SDUM812003]